MNDIIMDILFTIPIVFIVGILGGSLYRWRKDEKQKKDKRCCRLNKYNK